jgi:hypothetical protein
MIAGAAVLVVVLVPVVLLGGAANPTCTATPITRGGAGASAAGHFAAPLQLQHGRWYRVGATEYTGSGFGSYGPQSDLWSYPDTYAELSTLSGNPANVATGDFTFSDADALGELPYMTGLRVRVGGKAMVLYKRDVGYGQGPDGQGPGSLIYRLDVFSTAAAQLGVTKTPVTIALAPADGTAPTLGTAAGGVSSATANCGPAGGGSGPLPPLNDTDQVQIQPDGSATAPASAPQAVKLAVGAANQIDATPYPEPTDVHYDGQELSTLWPAYDCSATVSYVLYRAGLRGVTATDSSGLMSYGDAGPGRWITIYANTTHTWIVIGGRAFDTSHYGASTPAGTGPRWLADPIGNLGDGLSYVVRHPPGL